jgi:hypothetical protein
LTRFARLAGAMVVLLEAIDDAARARTATRPLASKPTLADRA